MFHYTVTISNITCHVYITTLSTWNSTWSCILLIVLHVIYYSTFPLYASTGAVTFDNLHPVKQLPRDATGHAVPIKKILPEAATHVYMYVT